MEAQRWSNVDQNRIFAPIYVPNTKCNKRKSMRCSNLRGLLAGAGMGIDGAAVGFGALGLFTGVTPLALLTFPFALPATPFAFGLLPAVAPGTQTSLWVSNIVSEYCNFPILWINFQKVSHSCAAWLELYHAWCQPFTFDFQLELPCSVISTDVKDSYGIIFCKQKFTWPPKRNLWCLNRTIVFC